MGAEGEGAVPIKTSVTFLFGGSRDWLAACAILAKEELPPLRCLREGFVMLCSKVRECGEKKSCQCPRPEIIVGTILIPL